jgi:hypothetical protein
VRALYAYTYHPHPLSLPAYNTPIAAQVGKEGAGSVCLCLSSPPFEPVCIYHIQSSTGTQGGCWLCMHMLIIPTLYGCGCAQGFGNAAVYAAELLLRAAGVLLLLQIRHHEAATTTAAAAATKTHDSTLLPSAPLGGSSSSSWCRNQHVCEQC